MKKLKGNNTLVSCEYSGYLSSSQALVFCEFVTLICNHYSSLQNDVSKQEPKINDPIFIENCFSHVLANHENIMKSQSVEVLEVYFYPLKCKFQT